VEAKVVPLRLRAEEIAHLRAEVTTRPLAVVIAHPRAEAKALHRAVVTAHLRAAATTHPLMSHLEATIQGTRPTIAGDGFLGGEIMGTIVEIHRQEVVEAQAQTTTVHPMRVVEPPTIPGRQTVTTARRKAKVHLAQVSKVAKTTAMEVGGRGHGEVIKMAEVKVATVVQVVTATTATAVGTAIVALAVMAIHRATMEAIKEAQKIRTDTEMEIMVQGVHKMERFNPDQHPVLQAPRWWLW